MTRGICSFFLLFLSAAPFSYAQSIGQVQTISTEDIQSYLNQINHYAIIYNGRAEDLYHLSYTNHPYLGPDDFSVGTLCHSDIIYTNVMIRYDMHRGNLLVKNGQSAIAIELDKEKVNWAAFNGYKIVAAKEVDWENVPDSHFLILLHEGTYPIMKISASFSRDKVSNQTVEHYFEFKNRYYICVNGVCFPLKNKKSLLNHFADKRRELDQYAKQIMLDFRKNPEVAYVELVKHYERLTR